MNDKKVSRTLSAVIVALFLVVIATTDSVFASSSSVADSSGGTTTGSTTMTTKYGDSNDYGDGITYRQPHAWLSRVQLTGLTTCGGYLHQIGAVTADMGYGVASATVLTGSRTRCPDSTNWRNIVNGTHTTFKTGTTKYAEFKTSASIWRP